MTTGANDNHMPDREDRLAALDLVRAIVAAGDELPTVDGRMARMLAVRVQQVARALEVDALAVVRRAADGRPLSASLTEFGSHVGERLASGDIALMPARGGIRLVPPTELLRPSGKVPEATVAGRPFSILAIAPDHYHADVVEGSATSVVIDGLQSWAEHPAARIRRRGVASAVRAWEVFSMEGVSYGLVLEAADGFHGVGSHGGGSCETSLAAAAWQVRVNC
ncbi:MAG: hypothetical protein INR70_16950 [Parafilimonas terrae]|nr:hypothetical protein [Parafilimonas terrae]